MNERAGKPREPQGPPEKERRPVFSFVSVKVNLVEMVYDRSTGKARFVYLDEQGIPTYVDMWEEDGVEYVPHIAPGIPEGVVLIPSHVSEYGTTIDLIKEVEALVYRWVDIRPASNRSISVWYVMLSYCFDFLRSDIPILRFRGDSGCGKSRALYVIGSVCYRPIISGGATPAFWKRLLDTFHGTAVMDEADWGCDEALGFTRLLNVGNTKGGVLGCMDTNDTRRWEFFNIFSPKVVASRRSFHDDATESRCIIIPMQEMVRNDIPVNLPPEFEQQAAELRAKLLLWRLRAYGNIEMDFRLDVGSSLMRVNQVLQPIASIIKHSDPSGVQLQEFLEYVQQHTISLVEEKASTHQGLVVNALHGLLEECDEGSITAEMISERITENGGLMDQRFVGRVLKEVGLPTVMRDRRRVVKINEEVIERLRRRYVPGYEMNGDVCNINDINDIDTGSPAVPVPGPSIPPVDVSDVADVAGPVGVDDPVLPALVEKGGSAKPGQPTIDDWTRGMYS